jgi:hypothetical protein
MDDDHVGAFQDPFHGKVGWIISVAAEVWVGSSECGERGVPMVSPQVADAPAVSRLIDLHGVSPGEQLRGNAAKEVGIAVVPVGDQGVVEQDKTHRS